MDNIRAKRFLMGWFDPLSRRLVNMAAYDAALNSRRVTVTVRTIDAKYWGLL